MSKLNRYNLLPKDLLMIQTNSLSRTPPSIIIRHSFILLILIGILTACTPTTNIQGQISSSEKVNLIKLGQSNKNDVINLLGTPSITSVYGDKVWYYLTQTTETKAFFKPVVIERKIYAIIFNNKNKVINTATYTEKDSVPISLVSRVTPTSGNELTILQQLFANLGRFSGSEADLENK
ncbi:MAG: cell envelope protein SmpA [Alphaproteobacteria bacterium]|jgi:outer membrane protein assembly factor BamE (lipoprotein component of BamABCDE complex)|nr:cell envelope protein SmpA [Alphaproteobacteria bacterium]PPR13245.1 MAG: hypothetical protein CFH42_01667 [Alphaproteobacteria bacterium MarineAlpha12_Bin1]